MTEPAFDPQTGEVVRMPGADRIERQAKHIATLEEKIEQLEAEKHLLFKANQRLNAEKTEWRKKRNSAKELDPFFEDAQECFELWKELCSPKAREFSGKRYDNTMARLRAGIEKERILRAIRGMAKKPYVTDAGRSETGKPSERHADLELICRSEQHVDRFGALDEDEEPEIKVTTLEVSTSAPHLRVIEGEPDEVKRLQDQLDLARDHIRALELEDVPILVPSWPVTCERGCTPEQMLEALWPYHQYGGFSGCPSCRWDVIDKDGRKSGDWIWRAHTPGLFGSVVAPAGNIWKQEQD